MAVIAGLAAAGILLLVIGLQCREAWPALRTVGVRRFLTDATWHPLEGAYGIAPMLWGTALATAGALALAAPLGVLSAVFERFYAPHVIGGIYRRIVEVVAGMPSVVIGLWGLVSLVPRIAAMHPPGASLLAAILVLALMILPTIALVSEASLRAVPSDMLRAAAALGLSRWATVRHVALPAARAGIAAAITLGAGRALGETMAVLMVAGNVVQRPASVFSPVRTLTANIALEMPYAEGLHRSALFVSGLALSAGVALLVLTAELARERRSHG